MITPFQSQYTLKQRKSESKKVLEKYPSRKPIIVEKQPALPNPFGRGKEKEKTKEVWLTKRKYLVPDDLTIGQFMYVLRKRMHLRPEESIFIFIRNTTPQNNTLICELYDNFKDEDGFLYLYYSFESVFG